MPISMSPKSSQHGLEGSLCFALGVKQLASSVL